MAASKISIIFGLFQILIAISSASDVELTASASTLQEGDSVTFNCDVTGFQLGFVLEWYKVDGADELKLAVNKRPEQVVTDSLTDFGFDLEQLDGGIVRFTATVQNAKPEYTGMYSCRLQTTDEGNIEKVVDITVLQPLNRVALFIDDVEITEDTEIELDNVDSTHNVRCEAIGGNPAPMIHVMRGDMDISAEFGEPTETINKTPTSISTFNIPSAKTVVSKDVAINSQFSHKDLFCKAHTKGLPKPMIESFKYHITFSGTPPEINCDQLTIVAEPYSTHVKINCTVEASPSVSDSSVSFKYENANTTHLLKNNDRLGRYIMFTARQDSKDPLKYYMDLTLERVSLQMFTTYTFSATNEIATTTKAIELQIDNTKRATDNDNAAMTTTAPLATTLFCILVAMVCHL